MRISDWSSDVCSSDLLLVEQVNLTAIGTEPPMAKMREYLGTAAADAAWKWTFHPPTPGEDVDEDYWAVRVPVDFQLYDVQAPGYGKWQVYLTGPRGTALWARDDAAQDAIHTGGSLP